MGAGTELKVVADAGPLIHLQEIGRLPLLGLFHCVHLAGAVWRETVEAGRVQEAALRDAASIRQHSLDSDQTNRFVQSNRLGHLQPGRSNVCSFAGEFRAPCC